MGWYSLQNKNKSRKTAGFLQKIKLAERIGFALDFSPNAVIMQSRMV